MPAFGDPFQKIKLEKSIYVFFTLEFYLLKILHELHAAIEEINLVKA